MDQQPIYYKQETSVNVDQVQPMMGQQQIPMQQMQQMQQIPQMQYLQPVQFVQQQQGTMFTCEIDSSHSQIAASEKCEFCLKMVSYFPNQHILFRCV